MCGVLGAINAPVDRGLLDLLAHRGPDGEGLTRLACGPHQVVLGHRRLAIVDLSAHGAQPICTADGQNHLVYNGEIYNHQDIRRDLAQAPFKGHSDTETLLQGLAAFGIDVVRRLNGIFAFAYLDLARRRLYLARDPFGIKPVYYSFSPKLFCFASEIGPLLRMAPATVEPGHMATLLKLRFSPAPETIFRGINKLRPGHILEVALDGDELSCREYPYIGPVAGPAGPGIGFPAALDRYGSLFEQAVRRQLMADVEVGILLSGGVDSALVAALAQRHSQRRLKAFTVGFRDAGQSDVDEIRDAAGTARILGLEHHVATMGFDDFLATLRECVAIVEEPLATTSMVPMHHLARLAGSQVKVVMSGQGADEPLGGYVRYQGELCRRFIPASLARLGTRMAGAAGVRNEHLSRGLAAFAQDADVDHFLESYAVFGDEEIARLIGTRPVAVRDRIEYLYDLLGCAGLPGSAARMMALDLRLGLSDDLLLYTDKVTMRQSLECRVPILDLDLVAFIESLPADYRVRIGRRKIIHKKFAEQRLPASIVHRKKKGFSSPTKLWFRDSERLRAILLDRDAKFASYFDLEAVDDVIGQHGRGFDRERHIFLLLCLHYWFDHYA